MPRKTAKIIEKVIRDFFWDSSDKEGHYHLVDWSTLTRSKEKGGLGIGDLCARNEALMSKWWWRLHSGEEGEQLWKEVILSKFGQDMISPNKHLMMSPWKYVLQLRHLFSQHTTLNLGCGRSFRFWEEEWVDVEGYTRSLRSCFPDLYNLSMHKNTHIVDRVVGLDEQGKVVGWSLSYKRNLTRQERRQELRLIQLLEGTTLRNQQEDKWSCTLTPTGVFTVKDMYRVIVDRPSVEESPLFSNLWSIRVPYRVRVFLWLCLRQKLLTHDEWQKRNACISLLPDICVLCYSASESIDHLCTCAWTNELYDRLTRRLTNVPQVFGSCRELMTLLFSSRNTTGSRKVWSIGITAILWMAWQERNNRIFMGTKASMEQTWDSVQLHMTSWLMMDNAFSRYGFGVVWRQWSEIVEEVT